MSLSAEIDILVGKVEAKRGRLIRLIHDITERTSDAQRLFIDPETGQVKPEAARFFALLARHAGLDRTAFHVDSRFRDYLDGQQALLRFMLDSLRLDEARLRHFKSQLNTMEDPRS